MLSGKFAGLGSRRLGRGGGSALPGLVAERIDPNLLRRLAAQLGRGSVVVTGTNGKTTTSRMLADIARTAGWRVVHNRSGSNLMRGLTATLLEATNLACRVAEPENALGVFEVDEATLLHAVPILRPRVIVVTNLFRDQLDRYGEVDSILSIWRSALSRTGGSATVVLNADDPSVAALANETSYGRSGPRKNEKATNILFYGLDDMRYAAEAEHAADSRWCLRCGNEYRYWALYFGHIGLWSCPGCGAERPKVQVSAQRVELRGGSSSSIELRTPGGMLSLNVPLGGLYNVYNALAAVAGASALGLSSPSMETGLSRFSAVFGRQERLMVQGRAVEVLLCKNPAGLNQVLHTITAEPGQKRLLLLLNDGIADGRDVSWIWDADYELLAGRVCLAVASGRRGADLALRLKYAGLGAALLLEDDSGRALDRALAATPVGECLYVLPTYTAMLAVREELARLSKGRHYWQD
ncbi:MAG: MurT ligase domain-containing protein [Dehalococcoidia bacterium]